VPPHRLPMHFRRVLELLPACPRLLLSAPALFSSIAPLRAQTPVRAEGHVVRMVGRDSVPEAQARVLLHRVGRAAQGPVDSTTTNKNGEFRFRFVPDTNAVYLTSTRHQGIEYFSPAVHTNPALPDTALFIVVSDTSSSASVELEARHLVVADPGEDGSRGVLDLIILRNRGDHTRVSSDTSLPSWSAPLPSGTLGFEPGESDVSPNALRRVGNRVELLAPIAPGEKQLVLQYGLPASAHSLDLPFEGPADLVNVLIGDRGARVSGGGLAPADTEVIQGRTYQRWMGPVAAGAVLRIRLNQPDLAPGWLLPALVAGFGGALIVAATRGLRGPAVPTEAGGSAEADVLLERLAQLDARYAEREAETALAEWERYEAERASLKSQLGALLASRSRNV
jgi:hypothetical protein